MPSSLPPLSAQIRNQKDREAYEEAWQAAHREGSEYEKRWGRAKVQPSTAAAAK